MEYDAEKFNRIADKIIKNLSAFGTKDVLIGYPGGKPREGDSINLPTLAYIHENGAPEAGIPARPFLRPGVIQAQPDVLNILQSAIARSLKSVKDSTGVVSSDVAHAALNQCGLVASSRVRAQWDSNNWTPLKPETVKARIRRQGARGGNKAWRKAYREYAKGMYSDPSALSGMVQPLLDTGALRQGATYVIGEKGEYDADA